MSKGQIVGMVIQLIAGLFALGAVIYAFITGAWLAAVILIIFAMFLSAIFKH